MRNSADGKLSDPFYFQSDNLFCFRLIGKYFQYYFFSLINLNIIVEKHISKGLKGFLQLHWNSLVSEEIYIILKSDS